MTVEASRALYRRWLDDLWSRGADVATELVAPDFVGHWPDREVRGPAELAAVIAETRGMVAGLRFALEVGPLVEGDLVAARWTGTGSTPDGPVSFVGNDLLRTAGGRFVEYWVASAAR